ncbi:MAG TPA: restriction endonuclease subunit S [Thiomicrospira sp.]|nr:restriction endonuclease subunit S [Thiomicrospira sp.]
MSDTVSVSNGEWREYQLEEIAHINPTERLPKGTIAKKVAMEYLQPFTKTIPTYSLEKYKGSVKFRNGDTVMARITPSLENGKTAYVDILDDDEVGYGSTEFIVLKEKASISDKQFIYYFAISPELRDIAILSMTGSSGRQRVQTDVVKQHEFLLPPLPEQKAIAEVLSSLDDKIDLLHRQNKTPEQMAETLFRQWFVEEVGEDWGVLCLSDVAEIKNGFSFSSKSYIEYEDGALEVFKMGHIEKGGGLRQNPKINYVPREERINKHILNKGDIVMAMTDMKDNVVILGVPAMIDKNNHYVLNQRVARIYLKPNSKIINNYLLYIQLNDKDNISVLQSK